MTHLDLFSGIGGFALAARWAGIKTVQFVELDPFCQKVLAKNFPGVPIHDDITTYTATIKDDARGRGILDETTQCRKGSDSSSVSCNQSPFLLTGGFPCQPFSCAGKRRGKEDDRYLWPEMLRVVSEAKPTWIIGENVAGFINMGLDDCISDLEDQGYEVQAFIIPACAVNAPHRRDRVWIVANSQSGNARQSEIINTGREGEITQENRLRLRSQFTRSDCHATNTESEGLERWIDATGIRVTFRQTYRMPQWNENWLEVATRLCRVGDGLPRQVDRVNRLKALGNAIVPQVAYRIMEAIGETHETL